MQKNINHTKLENGLEIITIDFPSYHSVTSMVAIRSGSRYENASNNGIAHFLEHMAFKGTENFDSPKKVSEAIEGIGGYLNAWTSVDHTTYWNTVPSSHIDIGVLLPMELAFKPLLRQKDLEKERGVIIEEIRRMNDNPADIVDEISHMATFSGSKLGQSVIGTEKNIAEMTVEQFHAYHDSLYSPAQSAVIVAGRIGDFDVVAKVKECLGGIKSSQEIAYEPFQKSSSATVKIRHKKTEQAHFILSVATPKMALSSKDRFIVSVLNSVLGTGMSSRLFMNIREQKGLAYSINSTTSSYQETGNLTIYGGVNVKKIADALEAVDQELERLKSELVPADELERTKRQILGGMDIGEDDPFGAVRWYGVSHLLGMTETRDQARQLISQVTAEDIQQMAKDIFAKDKQVLSVVGPFHKEAEIKKAE